MCDSSDKEYPDYFVTGHSIKVENSIYVLGRSLYKVSAHQAERLDYGIVQKLPKKFLSKDMVLP